MIRQNARKAKMRGVLFALNRQKEGYLFQAKISETFSLSKKFKGNVNGRQSRHFGSTFNVLGPSYRGHLSVRGGKMRGVRFALK